MKNIISVFKMFLAALVLSGCEPVINKLAFFPDVRDQLNSDQLPPNVKEIFIETEDQLKIQSYLILNESSDKILIYFHGNAGNISHRLSDLLHISTFGVNVLGVGYRGYGKSEGKPSEKGIYIDGKSALNYVVEKLGFSLNNIVILGRSIGTTVAVNSSQNVDIGGVILVTPLSSGKDHAKSIGLGLISFLAGKSFDNIKKITNVLCPILVIHGTNDTVISFQMGKKVFNKILGNKKFVKIEGAGHNDLSTTYKDSYWPPIDEFIGLFKSSQK